MKTAIRANVNWDGTHWEWYCSHCWSWHRWGWGASHSWQSFENSIVW